MNQPRIVQVTPQSGYMLYLEYETGERKIFDVNPYIEGSWFGELKNERYFNSVKILPGGTGIKWANGQDIAPHELYEKSQIVF